MFVKKLLYIVPAILLSNVALADQVVLKNGDMFSGEIQTSDTPDTLIFNSQYGQLRIPRSDIISLTSEGTLLEPPITSNVIDAEIPDPIPEELSVTEKTVSALTSTDIKWSGGVNLAAQLRRGNSEQEQLHVDGKVELRRPKDRLTIYAEINQNESGDEVTQDDRQLEFNYDYFLEDNWFLQGRLEFEQDDVAELDLRSIVQSSLGYQFYERDDLNLKVAGGINFQREEFATQDEEDSVGIAWSLDYAQDIFKNVTFFHDHDITTPFDEFDAFLFESKTGIKTPFLGFLTSTAEIDFDLDNAPAPGARKADTIYRLKIGYEW